MNTMVGAAGVPLNNRTHRKSLIIDSRIGFTGGAGIADHWTGYRLVVIHSQASHVSS